jgi:hydroxybutyrate-dimer hydrolase
VAVSVNAKAASYATGNGTVNGTPATVVYNDSVGGAKSWALGVSPSTNLADLSLDSALCQRAHRYGHRARAQAPPPAARHRATPFAPGGRVQLNGNLRAKPVLTRSQRPVAVNHSARLHRLQPGGGGCIDKSALHRSHQRAAFDAFIPFSGFDTRYVPLHAYSRKP